MRAKILIFFINTTSALQKTWACFMKNISIFFYFLYESRKPLYKIFRDIENFYLKYPEAGFLLQNITEMRI